MLNLNKFSLENLNRIQKVLKIILDELEFEQINRLAGNKILLKKFEQEGLCLDDVVNIIKKINEENKNGGLKIFNLPILQDKKGIYVGMIGFRTKNGIFKQVPDFIASQVYGYSHQDLKDYIIISLGNKSLNELKKLKRSVDKKLKKRTEVYATEIKGQFKKLTEEKEDLKKEIVEEIKDREEIKSKVSRPFCITEGRWGFLKFNKYGEKIKVGLIKSRHFRLLQCLCEPLGVAKTIDSVFEAIRLPKDKKDSKLSEEYLARNRKTRLIEYAIKELQKNKKLQRKLKFCFDERKMTIWLEM